MPSLHANAEYEVALLCARKKYGLLGLFKCSCRSFFTANSSYYNDEETVAMQATNVTQPVTTTDDNCVAVALPSLQRPAQP